MNFSKYSLFEYGFFDPNFWGPYTKAEATDYYHHEAGGGNFIPTKNEEEEMWVHTETGELIPRK
jgi:hypothetical protein